MVVPLKVVMAVLEQVLTQHGHRQHQLDLLAPMLVVVVVGLLQLLGLFLAAQVDQEVAVMAVLECLMRLAQQQTQALAVEALDLTLLVLELLVTVLLVL
jgi:hypothetical protein